MRTVQIQKIILFLCPLRADFVIYIWGEVIKFTLKEMVFTMFVTATFMVSYYLQFMAADINGWQKLFNHNAVPLNSRFITCGYGKKYFQWIKLHITPFFLWRICFEWALLWKDREPFLQMYISVPTDRYIISLAWPCRRPTEKGDKSPKGVLFIWDCRRTFRQIWHRTHPGSGHDESVESTRFRVGI